MKILVLGETNSGKTADLLHRLQESLDSNPQNPVIFVTGQRREHQSALKNRLIAIDSGLSVHLHTLFSLRKSLFQLFGVDHFDTPPHFLSHAATLTLLQAHAQNHPHFFDGAELSPLLFQHILSRSRLRSANHWDWATFEERTLRLDDSPLAQAANGLLRSFQQALKQRSIFDFGLAQEFLLDHAASWTEHFRDHLWLVDDFHEMSYADQQLILTLAQNIVCTAREQGAITQHLGAYPEGVESLMASWDVKHLPSRNLNPLGEKIYRAMTAPFSELPPLQTQVHISHEYGQMLDQMMLDIQKALDKGIQPEQLTLVTWMLNESVILPLQSRFEHMGIPLDILRGSMRIQRYAGINTLLALCRLVMWQSFKSSPHIPPLSGYEMSQILMSCGHVSAKECAQLRFQFKDQLNQWGHYMKQAAQNSAQLKKVQHCIQSLRESGAGLLEVARTCWEELIMPSPLIENDKDMSSVRTFFYRLEEFTELQKHWPDHDLESLFVEKLLNEDIFEFPDQTQALGQKSVKLMTLHRLCEYAYPCKQQFWFDLKSEFWVSPPHPLCRPQILSRAWKAQTRPSLEEAEDFQDHHLALMLKEGLALGQLPAHFYASQTDILGKRQHFERLLHLIQK